ncbi:AI-2E family transporter [Oculatella sp. LEGE 06141]|uniref:AI-2E family transporter n=1 Tax=Oculatella sp. LEGE 06141 TaxID=1828648 RepID=UPI001880E6BD|nr:AI-2E family transporter [Oculatella sp. LEGE 06141]MBE9180545.1 AI-2E family transporter [Oculatella sp. LEGE 06141]
MKLGQWLGFLCLTISLIILWQIRQILLLIFMAVVLATALNSLVQRFQRSGIKRSRAVLVTLSLMLLLSVLFVGLIVPPFVSQFLRLVQLLPPGIEQALNWVETLINRQPDWFSQLELPSATTLTQELQPLVRNLLQNFFALFSNSLTVLLQFLLVMVLTIMLLVNPLAYRDAFIILFPSFYRRRADLILQECEIALGNWFGGVLVSSLCVALLSGIGLWALQIQLVLAHALLAGLLNFIPNIGPTLSLVFPLVVALLDTPWKAIAVIVLYLIIQQFESYWITPTVMARQVSLLPAITLAAQIFFASFFGFLGLLLALPLTVVAKVWIQEALIKDILNPWRGSASHQLVESIEPHGSEVVVSPTTPSLPEAPAIDEINDPI